MARDIAILVMPGMLHGTLATVLDLATLANEYSSSLFAHTDAADAVTVRIVSVDGGPVRASDGRSVAVDGALTAGGVHNAVIVAAMRVDREDLRGRLRELAPATAWLADQYRRGAWVAGAGSAIFLLAQAGLLAGGACAPPWKLETAFRRRHPDISYDVGNDIVGWDRVLTGRAIASVPLLALRLIEQAWAPNLADMLGKITRWTDGIAASERIAPGSSLSVRQDRVVARAQDALQRSFSHSVSLQSLAQDLGVSHRTLLRRFRAATGQTPQSYLQQLRLASAKQMLAHSTRPIDRIGFMVGYGDPTSFKRLFKREVGLSAAEFRHRAFAAEKVRQ